jgi:hypothetical protein
MNLNGRRLIGEGEPGVIPSVAIEEDRFAGKGLELARALVEGDHRTVGEICMERYSRYLADRAESGVEPMHDFGSPLFNPSTNGLLRR